MSTETVQDQLEALRRENADLMEAMASRARIEQAKGILMLHYGVAEDPAFRILVRWSNQCNVKLSTVAATLVQAAGGMGPHALETSGHPGLAQVVRDVTGALGTRERLVRRSY